MTKSESEYAVGAMHGHVLAIDILADQFFDADTAYRLRDAMLSLIRSSSARHVVLDFRNVTLFGSVAFLAFLAVRRHVEDGRVVICNLSETNRRVFETCRLISSDPSVMAPFEVADSLGAAIAKCSE